ncbi:MAG: aminodeoxychorismate synthase component I [Rhodocyclaceae bacterium]
MPAPFALLDVPGGGAYLFENLTRTLTLATTADSLAQCREAEAAALAGEHVVAALNYELGQVLEPHSGSVADGALGHFWIFSARRFLTPVAVEDFLAGLAGKPPRPAAIADFVARLDAAEHGKALSRIRDYIAAGDCYQINFTFPFSGQCVGDPIALYARLRQAQPVANGGFIGTPEACVLSLSPELFVERRAGVIRSRPMKGTAARSPLPEEDKAAREYLSASAKDRAENVMIVDLIRNDLGRIAEPGSVRVESMCAIETYPSVYQMTSTVSAVSDADLVSVLAALFPCGSITGAPKIRAMQIIHELETAPRGLYTGAIGWLGEHGDFSFNVAIRSLSVGAAGQVSMGVGSGIVWDSEPAAEYAECLLKAGFVTAADPGFRLIETLRLDDGVFPARSLHLERLKASARVLAFVFDPEAISARLDDLAKTHPTGVHRVRLTLARHGNSEFVAAPLTSPGDDLQAMVSPHRLDSHSPWLRHKTSVRDLYEQELARVQADPTVFDVVFLNERDEVCEGARSNVFVRMAPGAPLLTPPLACGLLPGVLRRQLLESGEAVERVLQEADLRRAAEVYLGNALRGLVPVRF